MRLKDVVKMNALTLPETTPSEYAFQYIDIGSVDGDGNVTLGDPIQFDDAPSRARRIVKRNDVLISTVRTYLKAIAPVDFETKDVIASTGFAVCTPIRGILSSYLAYAVRSDDVINEICKESSGISYPAINTTMLPAIEIPYCDEQSQRRIVAYLDGKTAAIDARVAVLEKKLAAYKRLKTSVINRAVTRGLDPKTKLKDSGVDWIGKVPSGWVAGRFKDVAMVRANLVAPDLYMDYPQIAPENIEKGTGKLLGYGTVRESGIISGNHLFKKGQIIYSKIRPILNKLVIADFDGLCSADMYPIDVLGDLRFVFYQMLAPVFVNQVAAIVGMRVKMPKINQEELSAVGMVIPPLVEQRAIADYLDAECAKIDKMAELVTREIELYKKLKRSLINEVVTGKRKVA